MFGPRNAAATYAAVDLEARVASASQHELIQMLFDGAILALNQACTAIRESDIVLKGRATSRAVSIIEDGLRGSLNKEKGGTIAENLDHLYESLARQILLASLRGEPENLLKAQKSLHGIRDAWTAIQPSLFVPGGTKGPSSFAVRGDAR